MTKNILLLALSLVVCCGVGFAENPFLVDCSFGWDGCYRPMQWMMVNVGISSTLTEPFAGVLSIATQQDGLNNLVVNHEFVLTPGVRLNIPLVTKMAYRAQDCTVRIMAANGKTVWSKKYELWDYSNQRQILHSLNENDLLIGLVGKRSFGILRLEEEAACQYGVSVGNVYVKDKQIRQLPWDWTGYCGVDLLVLYDADLSQCNRSQLEAMSQWVRNGGKMLLILSSNPLPKDSPLRGCLPFEVMASREQALPNFAGDVLRLAGAGGQDVVAWPVKVNDSKMCDFKVQNSGTCLFGCGYSGFGRVGVLSFDPASLKNISNSKDFWIHLISSVLVDPVMRDVQMELPEETKKGGGYNQYQVQFQLQRVQATSFRDIFDKPEVEEEDGHFYSQYYSVGLEQAGSNSVMEYLLNIPQMRPLSIWWVILLLVLLAMLLGPVDYIVLKRIDRQPLTWLTCTFWIVLFTVGAYYGVQALRSGDLQYRSVSVVDSISGDGSSWSVTHAGMFAPKSDEYRFDGVGKGQWWSAVSPEQNQLYSYNQQNATRYVYCSQYDGANLPYAIPVNIWTMQCLLCEESVDQFPVRATLKRGVNEQVELEVTNLSDAAIDKGYVLFSDERVFEFEGLASLATKQYSGSTQKRSVWKMNEGQHSNRTPRFREQLLNNEEAYIAKGSLDRTKAIGAMLERGAAVVCVEMNTDESAVRVKDEDCAYTNRKLYRLLVYPEEL